jgi:hypothetical protein
MPAKSTSTERSRKCRERKRCGKVVLQDLVISRPGIGLLVAQGWLEEAARDDPEQVREALVKMVNKTLSEKTERKIAPSGDIRVEPELELKSKPGRPPFRRALKSVLSLGLF